jgi:signal transduction histidine kinase
MTDEPRHGDADSTMTPDPTAPVAHADAAAELRRAAELAAIIESIPDGVFIGTAHGVTTANETALRQLGYPSLDALNADRGAHRHVLDARDVESGDPIMPGHDPFARALAGERAARELLVRHRESGEDRVLRVAAAPVRVGDGLIGAIAVSTDVTDRKRADVERASLLDAERQARAAAETANRAKSQFLAVMSHELRTPLNAILGYAQLLELGLAGELSAEQVTYVSRVQASGKHLLSLISEILDLSKVESGQMTVARSSVQVGSVIMAALELVRPQAAARGLHLAWEGCAPDFSLLGDEHRVRQILVNLLANAVKFTAPGGTLRLSCGTDVAGPPSAPARLPTTPGRRASDPVVPSAWVVIRVADTGIGIASDKLDQIFEPFVQIDAGHTRTQGGTGLGLAISRRLARLMGGDLTVRSRVGHGSVFTLWLPLPPDAAQTAVEAAAVAARLAAPRSLVTERLQSALSEVVSATTSRLRDDPAVPLARAMSQVELEDHIASFVADLAQAFAILDEAEADRVRLIRDGTNIQRIISEQHGRQRRLVGWTEEALRREFEILGTEVEHAVRHAELPGAPAAELPGVDDQLPILRLMLREAEEISVRGYHAEG